MTLFYQENTMSLITRFEDIQAWQEARKLVKTIYLKEYYEQARKTKALIVGFKHSLRKT